MSIERERALASTPPASLSRRAQEDPFWLSQCFVASCALAAVATFAGSAGVQLSLSDGLSDGRPCATHFSTSSCADAFSAGPDLTAVYVEVGVFLLFLIIIVVLRFVGPSYWNLGSSEMKGIIMSSAWGQQAVVRLVTSHLLLIMFLAELFVGIQGIATVIWNEKCHESQTCMALARLVMSGDRRSVCCKDAGMSGFGCSPLRVMVTAPILIFLTIILLWRIYKGLRFIVRVIKVQGALQSTRGGGGSSLSSL